MLKWNATKVKKLTATEIWLFIIGRVLMAFGLGVLAVQYFPQVAGTLGIPALVLGLVLFIVAARGLARPTSESDDSSIGVKR
jgi:hypothetical protein